MNHIVWHHATVTRRRREDQNGHRGAIIWFTGLSGAGKSTLARSLAARLMEMGGRSVTLLDGDIVRRQRLETVTEQISTLAEAICEAALLAARRKVEQQRGVPRVEPGFSDDRLDREPHLRPGRPDPFEERNRHVFVHHAVHEPHHGPAGVGVDRSELVDLADSFQIADVKRVHSDEATGFAGPVAEPERFVIDGDLGHQTRRERGDRRRPGETLMAAAETVSDQQVLHG